MLNSSKTFNVKMVFNTIRRHREKVSTKYLMLVSITYETCLICYNQLVTQSHNILILSNKYISSIISSSWLQTVQIIIITTLTRNPNNHGRSNLECLLPTIQRHPHRFLLHPRTHHLPSRIRQWYHQTHIDHRKYNMSPGSSTSPKRNSNHTLIPKILSPPPLLPTTDLSLIYLIRLYQQFFQLLASPHPHSRVPNPCGMTHSFPTLRPNHKSIGMSFHLLLLQSVNYKPHYSKPITLYGSFLEHWTPNALHSYWYSIISPTTMFNNNSINSSYKQKMIEQSLRQVPKKTGHRNQKYNKMNLSLAIRTHLQTTRFNPIRREGGGLNKNSKNPRSVNQLPNPISIHVELIGGGTQKKHQTAIDVDAEYIHPLNNNHVNTWIPLTGSIIDRVHYDNNMDTTHRYHHSLLTDLHHQHDLINQISPQQLSTIKSFCYLPSEQPIL
jgi:hypothetical protein